MTFFVDANVIAYAQLAGPHRDACLTLLDAVARGDADGRTSAAVLEEIWHLELSGKAGDLGGLTERAYTIFAPLLPVTDEAFRLALTIGSSMPTLGANDRVHAGTCRANGIDMIASADRDFDGIAGLRRIDPGNARDWRTILGP
jgi:predicted nucleic acid-binding protein